MSGTRNDERQPDEQMEPRRPAPLAAQATHAGIPVDAPLAPTRDDTGVGRDSTRASQADPEEPDQSVPGATGTGRVETGPTGGPVPA